MGDVAGDRGEACVDGNGADVGENGDAPFDARHAGLLGDEDDLGVAGGEGIASVGTGDDGARAEGDGGALDGEARGVVEHLADDDTVLDDGDAAARGGGVAGGVGGGDGDDEGVAGEDAVGNGELDLVGRAPERFRGNAVDAEDDLGEGNVVGHEGGGHARGDAGNGVGGGELGGRGEGVLGDDDVHLARATRRVGGDDVDGVVSVVERDDGGEAVARRRPRERR